MEQNALRSQREKKVLPIYKRFIRDITSRMIKMSAVEGENQQLDFATPVKQDVELGKSEGSTCESYQDTQSDL